MILPITTQGCLVLIDATRPSTLRGRHTGALKHDWLWNPWLHGGVVFVLTLLASLVVVHFARQAEIESERHAVQATLATLRARLVGTVQAGLLSVHGLTAVIAAQPDMGQAGFAHIARGLVGGDSPLRNISGAPEMVISLVYPLAGNEGAIGLDYRTHPTQREAALRAVQTRQPVMAGPLPLRQGGIGIIIREPVFITPDNPAQAPRLWGLVASVMDPDTVYRLSGLTQVPDHLLVAVREMDGAGQPVRVFRGDPGVFSQEPEIKDIQLPGTVWQMAAVPRAGWGAGGKTLWMIRLLGILAALVAGTMAWRVARANRALAASEERYRHLFERNPLPMLVHERGSLRLLAVNEAFRNHYGYSLEEAERLHLTDLFPPEERQSITELASRQAGLAYVGTWHHHKKDGTRITIEARSHDLDYRGRAARMAVLTDITTRQKAETALREQEEFFRLIAENIADLVAVLDLEGRRLYNSPSYRGVLGDPETLKGTDSFAAIHPDDREMVRHAFMETVASGKGQRSEFRFLLPDGSVRFMESQGGVICGADGGVERVVVVSRDITERKLLEEQVHQLNVELEERVRVRTAELAAANKELETFTYSVSHDLKAPLRGIDGYSRLLQEDHGDRLDEEGRLFLANVREGVARMSQLIDDLLDYSRMERRHLHGLPVDLARLLATVLAERHADLEGRGVDLSVDVDSLTVVADPDGLAMVLRNLVDNALKFSRDAHPPRLAISGQTGDASVILCIQDNGIGFDMQFHDRIFDIFQRLQRAEDYPGTGVGLAIVRKAMQRMGGRAWAESAPGQGARFFLELPR